MPAHSLFPAIQQQFQDALQKERLHHAWLLQGERGIGKRLLAEQLAATLLECSDAVVQQGAHPDLLTLDKKQATEKGALGIGVIRSMTGFMHATNTQGRYKVLIIDSLDALTTEAANAVLKAIEEPRPGTIIFLINHAPGSVPVTVRSRCRVVRITQHNNNDNDLPNTNVADMLDHQYPEYSTARKQALLTLADNKPGLALELAPLDEKTIQEANAILSAIEEPLTGQHVARLTGIPALFKKAPMLADILPARLVSSIHTYIKQQHIHPSPASNATLKKQLGLFDDIQQRVRDAKRLNLDWGQVFVYACGAYAAVRKMR